MLDGSGQTGLVFNGEVYNYRELRTALSAGGYPFRTDSDTEVILALYRKAGPECVHELRGMFAFALWDDEREQLLLVRDRLGKKPLFYTVEDGCLYFASTLASLRQTSSRRWDMDPAAVDAFLTLSYIPAPLSVFRQVRKVRSGNLLTVDANGISTRQFWDLTEDVPYQGTFAEAVDRLDELINTSVELRLRSDVPLGIFLSGGIDSSLVTAVAVRQSSTPVRTFSIGFEESGFDESVYAGRVAAHLGTTHHLSSVRPDLMGVLPSLVWHFGEPYADATALPTWTLAKETRAHVKVALGGDGGDECFAGYPWYRLQRRLTRLKNALPEAAFALASQSLGRALRRALPRSRRAGRIWRGLDVLAVRRKGERFATLRTFIGPEEVDTLFAGDLLDQRENSGAQAHGVLTELYDSCTGNDLRKMRFVDIASYLADGLLPKVDVATMAHGLEVRAPLLDQEIVRFGLSLPDAWLIDDGGGKRILREVLKRYVPMGLFERPKQGFDVPLQAWFKGSLLPAVESLSTSERLIDTGWFDPAGIRALILEHRTGFRDQSQRLYSLLVLDEWLKGQ